MESNSTNLISLKKDAEQLQKRLEELLGEASSYKDATKSLQYVTDNLKVLLNDLSLLAENAYSIIEVLGKLDYRLLNDIKAGTELIADEVIAIREVINKTSHETLAIKELLENQSDKQKENQDTITLMLENIKQEVKNSRKKIKLIILGGAAISFITLIVILLK